MIVAPDRHADGNKVQCDLLNSRNRIRVREDRDRESPEGATAKKSKKY
jgi:hypothetical protein